MYEKRNVDKSGSIIVKVCIFSIVISLTALLLCGLFKYLDRKNSPVWNSGIIPTVVIDAGHGGSDGGASSESGLHEKDLNLYVALAVGNMLKSSGFNVVYTRTSDEMLSLGESGSKKMQDLKKRVMIAENEDNAIFVSIHMNKFSSPQYSGLQVFYSDGNSKSEAMARIVQAKAKELLQKDNEREIKSAGSNIYILDKIKLPAVLIECGFLSNPDECAKLSTEEYKKEIASVIYCSVIEFLERI